MRMTLAQLLSPAVSNVFDNDESRIDAIFATIASEERETYDSFIKIHSESILDLRLVLSVIVRI